jgi:hypothetical protein
MKQKTIITIGVILSLLTVFIIVYKEEVKAFLKGSDKDNEPANAGNSTNDSGNDLRDAIEQTEEVKEITDTVEVWAGSGSNSGYTNNGELYSTGAYIDMRANENLSEGQENLEVLYLQNQINNVLNSQDSSLQPLELDAYFGPKTQQALISTFGVDNITVRDINDNLAVLMS